VGCRPGVFEWRKDMKTLKCMMVVVPMLLLFASGAQAKTEKMDVLWYEDFPPDMLIDAGSFTCTGGGEPVGLFACSAGSGIHLRGMTGYTCLLDGDGNVIATTWFSANANWDEAYTGPLFGEWKVFMGSECSKAVALAEHESYFAGTFSGKRSVAPSAPGVPLPMTWLGTWKLNGFGVGDFEGVQFKSVNEYVTYNPILFQYEFIDPEVWLGIQFEPEGTIHGTMILHDD